MRKIIYIVILGIFFCLPMHAQKVSVSYYYYKGEKIYLQQRTDKVLLKFAPNVTKSQIDNLLNCKAQVSNVGLFSLIAILDVGEKSQISSIVNSYKAMSEVASVVPMFQYGTLLQGITDEFMVKLKTTTSYQQLQQLVVQNRCKIERGNAFVANQFILSVSKTSNLNALQMSNLFYETGLFEFAEPNFVVLNAFLSSDPYFDDQWALKNQNSFPKIDVNAERAWTVTQGSPNIKIAVIDDGVDLTHPDLQSNLLTGINSSYFESFFENYYHGTACAGIIGAVKDNNVGISGIAPNCKIIPMNALLMGLCLGPDNGVLSEELIGDHIHKAWQNGADVISNAWQISSNSYVAEAIDSAVMKGRNGKGCVVVAAAGDGSAVSFPAYLGNVIAVGSINSSGSRSSFSAYGNALSLVAPGEHIMTTDLQGNQGSNHSGNYDYFSGTSAAAAHVAGVAALVLSQFPDLTQVQVRQAIESSATKLPKYTHTLNSNHPNGTWNNEVGYGLVNAYAALKSNFIIGHASIYCDATYTLTNNLKASSWHISPNNFFTIISSDSTSVTLRPTTLKGQVATLAVDINGVEENLIIEACNAVSTGPDLISAPTSYTVTGAPVEAMATWQLGPGLVNTMYDPHTTLLPPIGGGGHGGMVYGVKSVIVRPADGVTSCYKSWLIPTVTHNGCSFTLDTVHVYVGFPPNHTAIGSKQNNKTKTWGGRDMYCSFSDTITYAGNVIQKANSSGITSAAWIPTVFNEVSFAPNQIYYPGSTIIGTKGLYIGSSANVSRIGVSVQNRCGWSDTVTIRYYPGSQCKGLVVFFSPNPTNNTLTVEFDELPTAVGAMEYYTVKLYDNAGLVQRQAQVQHRHSNGMPQPITFDTSTLRPGTYYLHVEGAGELVREQVIVIP